MPIFVTNRIKKVRISQKLELKEREQDEVKLKQQLKEEQERLEQKRVQRQNDIGLSLSGSHGMSW